MLFSLINFCHLCVMESFFTRISLSCMFHILNRYFSQFYWYLCNSNGNSLFRPTHLSSRYVYELIVIREQSSDLGSQNTKKLKIIFFFMNEVISGCSENKIVSAHNLFRETAPIFWFHTIYNQIIWFLKNYYF